LKFPANYAIPAHSHPTDENVVVVSGALTFGMGDKLTKKAAGNTTLRAGGFAVYGQGPVEFRYVNSSDDPREGTNNDE
jgi:hypothetical protein